MKVTQVAIRPTEASDKAGRPALTPELLAASGARYSRNNEGLEAILSKIDPKNLEKSVDSIFRMVDYGHQSIADMVPVAIFIDGVSIWLAYYLWTLCPTAGGQESSTRYIKMSLDGLISPEELGIPEADRSEWLASMNRCFEAYQAALGLWDEIAAKNPRLMGIPQSLLDDPSDAAQKKVQRMKRNYSFDRARCFLPVAAATNVMLIMSARGWVSLCQNLLSHALPECRRLGELLREELKITAPRMLKHAQATESHQRALSREFEKWVALARKAPLDERAFSGVDSAIPSLSLHVPEGIDPQEVADDLSSHANRYAPVGSGLQRIGVRFGWSTVGFAEIRDLNRHRTGHKHCPLVPSGFYSALDQLPPDTGHLLAQEDLSAVALAKEEGHAPSLPSNPPLEGHAPSWPSLLQQVKIGRAATAKASQLLRSGVPTYIYWSVLGTEYPFEHLTTADKFIYEAELRTGTGAHYRYAKHLRDVLALWYEKFPSTRGLILEGSAEPE